MESSDVLDLYNLFSDSGIVVWLDGGWAVDAHLGKQTRPHEDLDIIIQTKDVPKLRSLLSELGYKNVPRDDTREENFVLGNEQGLLVDVHAFHFDENGDGIYGNLGAAFPKKCFDGIGEINGQKVKCISPEQMVIFHTNYTPDENDVKDVLALCKKFNIEVPLLYRQYLSN